MPNSQVVRDHLTAAPYVIDRGVSLAHAAHCLDQWGVDCVPVLHDGDVCGLVCAHDLIFANELGALMHDVQLRDILLHNVHLTSPEVPLRQVARAMVLQKSSWTVVRDGLEVVGVLSWSGVLSGLAGSGDERELDPSDLTPSTVRNLILAEHANIRHLLGRAENAALRVAATPSARSADLIAALEAGRTLCAAMTDHLRLEEQVLAPTLERLDAWGRVRAERLRAEHAEQTLVLRAYAQALEQMMTAGQVGPLLAAMVQQLVERLREDMRIEEESLLRSELFADDPTAAVVEAG